MPGERWQPVAGVLNGYQEAADYVRDLKQSGGAVPGRGAAFQPAVVTVKNDSGGDCGRFAVLGIDRPIFTPDDNLSSFASRVGFSCVLPESPTHAGRFVVLLRPLRQGELGPAAIAGAVQVRVYVNSTDDKFCDIIDAEEVEGETCCLGTGGSGARDSLAGGRCGGGPNRLGDRAAGVAGLRSADSDWNHAELRAGTDGRHRDGRRQLHLRPPRPGDKPRTGSSMEAGLPVVRHRSLGFGGRHRRSSCGRTRTYA